MGIARVVLGPLVVGALALACGATKSSEADDGSSDPESGDSTRGEVACDTYKRTFCSYGVDCGLLLLTEQECLSELDPVVCRSPRLADDCDRALRSSSCVDAPANCDVVNVADTTEARAACEAFSDAACNFDERCGGLAYEDCRFDLSLSLPCDFAFIVTRDATDCLESLQAATCDTPLGPECEELFILL